MTEDTHSSFLFVRAGTYSKSAVVAREDHYLSNGCVDTLSFFATFVNYSHLQQALNSKGHLIRHSRPSRTQSLFNMSYTASLTGRERSRWPPLTRMLMSGEMSEEKGRELTRKEKFDVWMVNEGYRRLFVFTFAILHVMVFVFGMMNYGLKVGIVCSAKE